MQCQGNNGNALRGIFKPLSDAFNCRIGSAVGQQLRVLATVEKWSGKGGQGRAGRAGLATVSREQLIYSWPSDAIYRH